MLRKEITVVFIFYNRVRFNLVSCCVVSLSILFPVRSRVEFKYGSLINISYLSSGFVVYLFVTVARFLQDKPSARSKNLGTKVIRTFGSFSTGSF